MSEPKSPRTRRLPSGEGPGSPRWATESQHDTAESSLQDMYDDLLEKIYAHLDTISQYQGDDESFEIAETWLDNLSATLACWNVDVCASESFPLMKNSWLGTEIESYLRSINEQLTCDTTALRKVIFTDSFQRDNLNLNLQAADKVSDKVATPPSQVTLATEALERLQGFVRKVWQFLATQNPPVGPYKKLKSQIDERFRQVSDSTQSPSKQNPGTDGSDGPKEPSLGEEEVLAIALRKPPENTHHPSQVRGSTDVDYRGAVEPRPSLTQVPAPAESPMLLTAPRTRPIGEPQQTRLEDTSASIKSLPSQTRKPITVEQHFSPRPSTLPSQTNKSTSMEATAEPRVTAFDVFFKELADDHRHNPAIRFENPKSRRDDLRLANALKNRDLVFLSETSTFGANFLEVFIVDSSEYMLPHWPEAMFLLHGLIAKSRAGNPHSVEVLFSYQSRKIKVGKWSINEDLRELRSAMKDSKAVGVGRNRYSNLDLGGVLSDWLEPLRLEPPKTPAVLILTAGKWKHITFYKQTMRLISLFNFKLVETFDALGYDLDESLASMTFVIFGEALGAVERFPQFEDYLKAESSFINMHMEPSNGDIYRMLLGKLADDHNDRENPPDGKASPLMDANLKASPPPMKSDIAGPIVPGG